MRRYFLFFISFLAGAATLAAPLSAERASALRAQFQTRQRETLTWSATIVQTLTLPGVRDPVVSQGTLAYRAPDRLRLDYTRPAGEFVLVLGDRLFIQKTGARLAEKSLREDSAGKPFLSLLGLLRGQPAEQESDYTPEVKREGDGYAVVLTRKPDASSRMPARITNTIAADTLEVREVVVVLPSGGVLRYRFDDITRNRPLDAAHFTAPAEPTSRELR
ncbi:MAG: LolA family protein [Gammaproteobacteria bacterium]